MEIFSSEIVWEQANISIESMSFGVFRIFEARTKPVIARRDEGRDATIRNGDVYYRYGGRTQRILSAELEAMIRERVEQNNRDWIEHVQAIGQEGPRNAIVVRSEKSLRKGEKSPLVIDSKLAAEIDFIKEGHFREDTGSNTLRLVGDVQAVDTVEVERVVRQNIFEQYPLTATQLWQKVKKELPWAKQTDVWKTLQENKIKGDKIYSCYNYRNKAEEENHLKTNLISSATPVLYNEAATQVVIKLLKQQREVAPPER